MSIGDVGDEERDTFETELKKEGSFTCVEVKVESGRATVEDLVNSGSCVIEEYSESEDKNVKLSISRNVSIHSISDDEGFKQTPLPLDTPELEIKETFDFEIKESVEIASKESNIEDSSVAPENKAAMSVQEEKSGLKEASHQLVEEVVISTSQNATLLQKETKEISDIPEQPTSQKVDEPVQNKSIKKSVSFAETEDLTVESPEGAQKLNVSDSSNTSQNAKVTNINESIENKNSSKPLEAEEISNEPLQTGLEAGKNNLEPQEPNTGKGIEERKGSMPTEDSSQPESVDISESDIQIGKASSESKNGSRKASVERRESFSKVDITNVVETRKSSKGFIFNEVNKGELFESLESVENGSSTAQSGELGDASDTTGDSKTDELIKRIKKQRSVLEEILDKEEERNVEGTFKIIINAKPSLANFIRIP